ncbi:predicted protein [Chaetoceros tenuissimus]|uniref:Uncharacterized protein n=1 Tax=Chaetoceros tenuissimus TaxID=426638 RepID=A0AAD3D2J3_9STRA|nr:predicted protein [Chaetoceros tenuissimus]
MASSNKPPAMLRGSHIAAMKNISQQKREREAPPVERFTSKEDMRVADILLQIKNTDLFLEKDGEDIRQIKEEGLNEAYFASKLEASKYQDVEEIQYYEDDDSIPQEFYRERN